AERRETQLVGEGVPFGERQCPQRLVARDQCLEALELVALAVEAEGVHRGGEVEDELAAARRLEIEHGDDLVALEDDVVVEEIAVDDALRQLVLEISLEVIDLVVERADDPLEIRGKPLAHLRVEVRHAVVAEAVVDTLLVALADGVEVCEHAADVLDLRRREACGGHGVAFDVAVEREALAAHFAVMPAFAIGERLRAGEAVFAQEEQEIELALHLEFALHLVDAEQMFSAYGIEQIRGVDGSRSDSARRVELRETVVLDNFSELARSELGVNGHLRQPP